MNRFHIIIQQTDELAESIAQRGKEIYETIVRPQVAEYHGRIAAIDTISRLEQDKWGNWVINQAYNAAMLAEVLYVTTQTLKHEQLAQLSEEVGTDRTILVLCSALRGKTDPFPNLTVRKIAKQVLDRREWGHDDYSLKVENLPKAPTKARQLELGL